MPTTRHLPLLVLLALLQACASVPPAATTPANACASKEQRQFDFWLGQWDVASRGQPPRAINHIEMQAGGCVLRETYRTESGYSGMSMNWYEARKKLWRQTWIDNGGLILQLKGGLDPTGAMLMYSEGRPDAAGQTVFDQIRWSQQADGSVNQVWSTSPNLTGPWSVIFDGIYTRRSAQAEAP